MRSRDRRQRASSCSGRGGSASTAAAAWGISGWDASTAFASGIGSGVSGSVVTGVSVVALVRLDALPSTGQYISHKLTGTSGWYMRSNTTPATEFVCGNGAATATAPARTWVAGDVGKLHMLCVSCDITAVYSYFDNAQIGTSTALVGYAVPAGIRQGIGSTPAGGNAATSFTILGVAGRDSHLSLADFQTICAATKTARALALGGITMAHSWTSPVNTGTMTSTISDGIGADAMSFVVGTSANVFVNKCALSWGY